MHQLKADVPVEVRLTIKVDGPASRLSRPGANDAELPALAAFPHDRQRRLRRDLLKHEVTLCLVDPELPPRAAHGAGATQTLVECPLLIDDA